jgi:Calcineurin-like phosphoesterase
LKIAIGDNELYPAKYAKYMQHFKMESPFYSFNYGNVHFLAMATAKNKVIPYNLSSKQYEFVNNDLKSAHENKSINWIVVYSFRSFYSSNTTHPGLDELQDLFHPLFEKYGVDIVLQAHNHNYQRTYPILAIFAFFISFERSLTHFRLLLMEKRDKIGSVRKT